MLLFAVLAVTKLQGDTAAPSSKAIAQFCMSDRRVVFDTHAMWATGGPETLVQFALAIRRLCRRAPAIIKMEGNDKLAPRFLSEYPPLDKLPTVSRNELQKGDIFIITENQECEFWLVNRGVHVYHYLLSTGLKGPASVAQKVAQGCKLVAHNFCTGSAKFIGAEVSLPAHQHVHLYVTPSRADFCNRDYSKQKEALVLLDDDNPMDVQAETHAACKQLGCRAVLVQSMTFEQVQELLVKAMVVIDWCMVGSERMPLEASMCGAVMLTSASDEGNFNGRIGRCCGNNQQDFPLPARNLLRHTDDIAPTLRSIFKKFENRSREMKPTRDRFLANGPPNAMLDDVREFFEAAAAQALGLNSSWYHGHTITR